MLANYRGWTAKFQSTHPRGVRPIIPCRLIPQVNVSIHAPAWGATRTWRQENHGKEVSIHAPAWGATAQVLALESAMQGFNPRTRVGGDQEIVVFLRTRVGFNPRTRVGCDSIRKFHFLNRAFQSTHPRGVRQLLLVAFQRAYQRFNPRTRVGCDLC